MRRYLQSSASLRAQVDKVASGSIIQSRRSYTTSSSNDSKNSGNATRHTATLDKGKAPEHAVAQADTSDNRTPVNSYQGKRWGKYAPLSPNSAVRHRNKENDAQAPQRKDKKPSAKAFQTGSNEAPNEDFTSPDLGQRNPPSTPSTSSGVNVHQLMGFMKRNGEPSNIPYLAQDVDALRSNMQRNQVSLPTRENREWLSAEQDREPVVQSEEEIEEVSFSPGTFVEVRKSDVIRQGIVLYEAVIGQRMRVYSLAANGEAFTHTRSDVHFSIPNYVSADLAERCGRNLIHENPKQLEARVTALKQLQSLITDGEKASYGAKNMERHRHINIYNHCKNPDPNQWGQVSVADITKLIYMEPTALDYYGVHKYLMRLSMRYVASPEYHQSQTFYVRPENDIIEIQTVRDWIASHRAGHKKGSYSMFINKARQVLKASQKPFQGTNAEKGKVTQADADYTFDDTDGVFIGFLIRSMRPHVSNQVDPYAVGRSQILKDLLKDEAAAEYTDAAVHEVLIRLGVIPAWKDITELLPNVNQGYSFEKSAFAKQNMSDIVKRGIQNTPTAGTVLGPEDFHRTDPLESVRRDFGEMPVFVIDDVSAEELDDGISIEKVPGQEDQHWIHVHIADPASVIHPGHALARMAKQQSSSLYLAQRSFPLFPTSLMHHGVYGMSLGDGIKYNRPDKTITFSAKIDSRGDILDYKMSAGLIRNVKKLSYSSVDKALNTDSPTVNAPFGNAPEVSHSRPPTEEEVPMLQHLYRVAQRLERKRFEAGCMQPSIPSVEVRTSKISEDVQSVSLSGSKYTGFPDMSYMVNDVEKQDVGAHMMVAEMMKLACTVASMVARDNNLAVIRRGVEPMQFFNEDVRRDLLKIRTHQGYIPILAHMNKVSLMPSSRSSTSLLAHAGLGVSAENGYSRVTSPLRRFQDLICHWQFHHLLLGSKAPNRMPLSFLEMEQLIKETSIRDRVAVSLQRQDTRFFALMFIKRWLADTKLGVERSIEDPLANLEGYLKHDVRRDIVNGGYTTVVFIPKLGLPAQIVDLDRKYESLPPSTLVRVKVKHVELGIQRPALHVTLRDVVTVPSLTL